jgi:L-proline amide hydrolase
MESHNTLTSGRATNARDRRVASGAIPFRQQFVTWYQVTEPAAGADRAPLVILHGGPGIAHNYTKPMADLADTGRGVIHYDQLGCGLSTHLPDAPTDFWSVELFVEELRNLVVALDLTDGFHLLGQSWGGMLAPEYVLTHPDGVLSMTLASSPASVDLWLQSTDALRARLPTDVQQALTAHEAAGTTDSAEYLAAVGVFYNRFLCRIQPWPDCLNESFTQLEADPTVYRKMFGPSEFHCPGTLRDWTVVDRLPAIAVPTLVLAGEHDEAQRVAWAPFVTNIPGARAHVFPGASHTAHLEMPEEFNRIVGEFLNESERAR